MAHKGRIYPICEGRDWSYPYPNFAKPPVQFGFSLPGFTGTLATGWNSETIWSADNTRNLGSDYLEWLWENVPGTDPRTKFRTRWYVSMANPSALTNWKFAVCIDSTWSAEQSANGIHGVLGDRFVVSNVNTPVLVVGSDSFRAFALRIQSRNWADF